MKITYNGKEHEAYALVMKRENALEILNGTKRVEIRAFTEFYDRMFLDMDIVAKNERDPEHFESPMKKTYCAHFYTMNKKAPWFLDVSIDNIGIASMIEEDIKWLNETYDFHDFDNEWQQFVGKPDDEIPYFYYLGIEKILQHEGL